MSPASSRGRLSHVTVANLHGASAAFGMSAFGAKPENMCRTIRKHTPALARSNNTYERGWPDRLTLRRLTECRPMAHRSSRNSPSRARACAKPPPGVTTLTPSQPPDLMSTRIREQGTRGGRDHRNPRPASIGFGGRLRSESPADFVGIRTPGKPAQPPAAIAIQRTPLWGPSSSAAKTHRPNL
jgi:hypothetical protein